MGADRQKTWAAVVKAGAAHRKAKDCLSRARQEDSQKGEALRNRKADYLVACGWEVVRLYRGHRSWSRMWERYFKRPKGSTYHTSHGAMERQRVIDSRAKKKAV